MNDDLKKFLDLKSCELNKRQFYGKTITPRHHAALPRKIYFYWDKGFNQAPEIVRECYKSWVAKNMGWEVINLSEKEALDVLGYKKDDNKLPAHYADELRTKLLFLHGGVWVDSTVFCSIPLDYWILNFFNQTDFFAFYRPAKDRIISNFFIASTPGGDLISGWHDLFFQYASHFSSNRPYFSHHWIFEYLLRKSSKHRLEFELMPKISAEPIHFLQAVLKSGRINKIRLARLKGVPIHKLSYKFPDKINVNSLYNAIELLSKTK